MSDKNVFEYSYSSAEQQEIKRLREKYTVTEKKKSGLELLRELDERVTRKAMMYSLISGVLGAMLLGLGMSLIMSDLGNIFGNLYISFTIGIILGLPGVFLVIVAYPLYCRTIKKEREKIAPEMIRISDELLK